MNTEFSPLAIVGIGCLFPKAGGPGAYWANVKHGVDAITDVPQTHWNPDDYFDADPKKPDMTYARRGGFLDVVDFNPLEFGLPPRDIEATDTSQLLGLVAAKQALTDAKVNLANTDRSKISVILGVTGTLELVIPLGARLGHPHWKRALKDAGVADDVATDVMERIGESYVPWQENSFPGLLGNVVAGRIANKLDLHGTNCVVDAACASSLSAVHLAAMELHTGKADVVVTGGVDTFNDIFMYMCFSKTPALSPTGNSKPFDANGDGTILGEGLGVVVLKRLADAERDGDTVYAVLKGIGTSSDGKGNAIYAPSAEGQRRCLLDAYTRAGIDPKTVELVEAHGTGTKVGDAVEASGLKAVFGTSPTPRTAVGSVKSMIGHTKAAAGAASLIKAALSLYNKVLPPTLKVTSPVEPLQADDSPFYVNLQMRPWLPSADHPRRAGVSAFGFGGSNFHAVLEEHNPAKVEADWDGMVEILALSGKSVGEIEQGLPRGDAERVWADFARAAEASRGTFEPSAPCRLVLVAHRTLTDLPKLLAAVRAKLTDTTGSWSLPEGAYFGRGTPGKLAVLFPGQGSQRVGMLRDFACSFPEVLNTLADANEDRLADVIYPPTSFKPDAKKQQDEALRATDKAQPALGAVSYGAFKLLRDRFGLSADAFAGHSYGELPALTAAGRLTETELHCLSRLRGELMAKQRGGDPGAMLAVIGPAADVERVVREQKLDVVIANKNSPTQTVLSGSTPAIDAVEKALRAAKLKGVRLPVAAAFHSPLVADAATPFRQALDVVPFPVGAKPVFANTTASEYPADAKAARELLGNQLAKPVEFVEQVRAMWHAGVRTFVEVGPGRVLAKLTDAILADSAATVLSLDTSEGSKPGALDLAHLLARLAAGGYAMKLAEWERGSRCRPISAPSKPGMTVPICGANYVSPRAKRPPRATVNGTPSKPAGTRRMNDHPDLTAALQVTQQTLAALQQIQEQTAALHKQFLDQQEQAQRTLFALVQQTQSAVMPGAQPVAIPAYTPPPPLPLPPPVVVPKPKTVSPPPPPPPAVAVPPPPRPVVTDGVAGVLLSVVGEKTGYPASMLTLDMALDADLGVDSIKRVEILSALQERLPHAPAVKPEHLAQLHTLRDVATFLGGGDGPPTEAVVTLTLSELTTTSPASITAVETLNAVLPPAGGDIAGVLLSVVGEKTGYPASMLTLDMALDADLGVDSIKRVEILSALQERLPHAPAVKPEHLAQLHTLRDVATFLGGGPASGPLTALASASELSAPKTEQIEAIRMAELPESALARPKRSENGPARPHTVLPDRIDRSVLQVVDIDLRTARPRVPLADGAEVWVVGATDDPLVKELTARLTALRFVVKLWGWVDPSIPMANGNPAGLVLVAPPTAGGVQVNRLGFRWLQQAGPKVRQAAKAVGGLVATVMRLDGGFGLADCPPTADPTAGGLAGLVKTVRHEWPEVAVKAIDVHPPFAAVDPKAAAAAVIDELLTVGPVEVGVAATHRVGVELARTIRKPGTSTPVPLGPKDVVLVTGGGRGVTAEVAAALGEAFRCTLVLIGRTPPPPDRDPNWATAADEAGLKAAAADHLGAAATPKAVAAAVNAVVGQREVRSTLARIEASGAKAAYLSGDVADPEQLADLLDRIQAKHGPVTGLIHGAGVLADRRIEDLTVEQFDTVYRTKVTGLKNLLDLLGGQPLKAMILFSSTTARLGRTGQLAYAVANEVLNKTAQVESRRRPNCRVVAVNWGPWEGGMVTPALRKVFETEGVGLIPLADGGRFAVLELNSPGKSVEVVALGQSPGGKSPSAVIPLPGVSHLPSPGSAGSGASPALPPPAELAFVFDRAVDLRTHPVLRSHVLDGWAVLPMALHLEWLAHAALHGNPGLVFHGFNEARITNGVKVDDATAATVRVFAGKAQKRDGVLFHVPVELRGRRKDGKDVLHSRAEVVLAAELPKPPTVSPPPPTDPYPHPLDEIYRYFLFHGPDLHAIERVDGVGEAAVIGSAYPAPTPTEWMAAPPRGQWLTDPLVIDATFQLMILWSFAQHGAGNLPSFAGRYRQFRRSFPAGPCKVVARVTRDNGTYARADIDILDAADGSLVARFQDYECVIDPALNQAFRRNQLAPRVKA